MGGLNTERKPHVSSGFIGGWLSALRAAEREAKQRRASKQSMVGKRHARWAPRSSQPATLSGAGAGRGRGARREIRGGGRGLATCHPSHTAGGGRVLGGRSAQNLRLGSACCCLPRTAGRVRRLCYPEAHPPGPGRPRHYRLVSVNDHRLAVSQPLRLA